MLDPVTYNRLRGLATEEELAALEGVDVARLSNADALSVARGIVSAEKASVSEPEAVTGGSADFATEDTKKAPKGGDEASGDPEVDGDGEQLPS